MNKIESAIYICITVIVISGTIEELARYDAMLPHYKVSINLDRWPMP